ncbi:hypothetical protein B0A50_07889 [Salinomyces thailandicus]|uniref:Protein kinase domain-containing protein n=1 Tax=Salinomyces thailandicus TaxID=706561 RepID=A0A4U0TLS1_9PEZI|nr:hypothetical protein B0A50_07889 [Salinomyces thailandica]
MATFGNQQLHDLTSPLTKLYSDTKKSALTSNDAHTSANEQFPALHRKYRIQKDRFITWGLAWGDEGKGPDGNIDDAVAGAGLTETVDSVLRNIKDVIEEVEAIQRASLPQHTFTHTGEKVTTSPKPATFDQARYQDLLYDLTTSIDTLYDLSSSRRAIARGEHPSFTSTSTERSFGNSGKPTPMLKSLLRTPSFTSETTLVNPASFQRPTLSPYAGLPPRIELSALRLPEEGPPPYEPLGVPSTTRFVGRLIRSKISETLQVALGSGAPEVPVLVEYSNFDSIYRDTHVPPPLQRLEALAAHYQPMRPESQSDLSLLGFFEDPVQPRIGLVYDVPYSIQNRLQGTNETAAQNLAPVSLLKMVQKASKSQPQNSDSVTPSLEHRFRLAQRLVEQTYALHACGTPHGNINSNSVVFAMVAGETFRPQHAQAPLFASFDIFSRFSVEGVHKPANFNIYRHPEDSSHNSERDTEADIRHDFYALALVLLEIGLWTPLGDLYKPKYTLADFKLRIEKLWIPKLAARCGSVYMRVVETCFRMVDDPELSGYTTDGVYEQLLSKLRRCCFLDEADDGANGHGELGHGRSASAAKNSAPFSGSQVSKQRSEPSELLRSQSVDVSAPSTPYWSSPKTSSTDARPASRAQLSRQASLRTKDPAIRRIAMNPSLKEFKRKVTLIQRRWRAHRARRISQAFGNVEESQQMDASTIANLAGDAHVQKTKRQRWPCLELPQLAKHEWEQKYCYQLLKLCEKALKSSAESSHISLTMYGETPETARPTFLITCEKSAAKIKHTLKRHFRYDTAMFDIRVKSGECIRRCRRAKKHGDSAAYRSMAITGSLDKAANPDYQERPVCGASIGAYKDEEHLPPVSFGGVVLVDGVAYGMSVHHMLESNEEEVNEEQADAGAAHDDDSDTSSIRSSDNISIYSHSDDESTIRPPSTLSDDDELPDVSEGDVAGITPDDYDEVSVTQPALDDAIDCDLHVDEGSDSDSDSGIDEDHLLSYKLGQVHASSGLKRSTISHQEGFKSIAQSLPQEIDWALFALLPPRVHPYNVVKGGAKYTSSTTIDISKDSHKDTYPTSIKPTADLACAKVHCLGRTSGLADGTISSTMDLVKIHGRRTFSASWTVDGAFGVGGDSGAWVVSNDDGRVCGHVLASKQGRTFICPMELLLEDIRATLGAGVVELPARAVKAASGVAEAKKKRNAAKAERKVEEVLGALRLEEREGGSGGGGGAVGGGVALPRSPVRRSMAVNRPAAVEIAG